MGDTPLHEVVKHPEKFKEALLLFQFSKALQKRSSARSKFEEIPEKYIEECGIVDEEEVVVKEKGKVKVNLRRSSCFVYKIRRLFGEGKEVESELKGEQEEEQD